VLYHSRWDGANWSAPIDVLASPDGESIRATHLRLDHADYVHAFWTDASGDIWHSAAHASRAQDAHGWLQPALIPTQETAFNRLGTAQDASGAWYLVYTNRTADTVRLLRSTDGEMRAWQERTLYTEVRRDTWIAHAGAVVAPDGVLWVWWHELDPDGEGYGHKSVVTVRSSDGGQTWTQPEQAVTGYYSADFRVIGDTMVRLVFGGLGTGGRYVAFSRDSGSVWTADRDIGTGEGEGMTAIGLAIDGAQSWHFVEATGNGFATVSWEQGAWQPLEYVVPPEEIQACCSGLGGIAENPVIGISDGNRAHVFFEEADRVLWYTSRQLDAPYVSPRPPLPTQAAPGPVVANPGSSGAAEIPAQEPEGPTAVAVSGTDPLETDPGDFGAGPWLAVVIGILPATLLVPIALAFHVKSRRSRR
jgi:hypothetical protein